MSTTTQPSESAPVMTAKRPKRTGVQHFKPGTTLFDGIHADQAEAKGDDVRTVDNQAIMHKLRDQADIAFTSLFLKTGSEDSLLAAKFTQAWVHACVIKVNGLPIESRTSIAKRTVLAAIPAEEAGSQRVRTVLNLTMRAFREAGDALYGKR